MLQLILAVFLMLTSSLHLLCAVAQGEPALMKHDKFCQQCNMHASSKICALGTSTC